MSESTAIVSQVNFAGSFFPIISINCTEEVDGEVFLSVTQGNKILSVTNLFSAILPLFPETTNASSETFKLIRRFISSSPNGILDFQPIQFAKKVYMANVLDQDQRKHIYTSLRKVKLQLKDSKKHGTLVKMLQEIQSIFEYFFPEDKSPGKQNSGSKAAFKNVSIKSLRKWFHRQMTRTTMITFNGGSSWRYLTQNGDRLNLNILSQELHSPLFDKASAQGIIFGVGNFGKSLGPENLWSTFVSSDFGKKWNKVEKEKLLYEMTDSADLVIMARDSEPTNQIMFSWDYGASFKEMIISDSSNFLGFVN